MKPAPQTLPGLELSLPSPVCVQTVPSTACQEWDRHSPACQTGGFLCLSLSPSQCLWCNAVFSALAALLTVSAGGMRELLCKDAGCSHHSHLQRLHAQPRDGAEGILHPGSAVLSKARIGNGEPAKLSSGAAQLLRILCPEQLRKHLKMFLSPSADVERD